MEDVVVQGNGHARFESGFKCALYIDDEGNQYCTAELIPLEDMIECNGNYELI